MRDQASKTQTKSRSIEHQTIAKAISSTRTRKSKTSATRTCSTTLKITGKWLRPIQECSWVSNSTPTCNKIRPRSKTCTNNENQLSTSQGHSKTASSNWGIFWTIINRLVHPRKYIRKWRSQSKQVKLQLLEVALKTEPKTWSVEWKFKGHINDLDQQTTMITRITRFTHRRSRFQSIALAKIEKVFTLRTSTRTKERCPTETPPKSLSNQTAGRYNTLRIVTSHHLQQSACNRYREMTTCPSRRGPRKQKSKISWD